MKRVRSSDDVDGIGTSMSQSKKQRLRLQLFTSRLSTPYAAPSSYIAGPGENKIAALAKQKALGWESREGNLRRVAGMNSIKKQLTDEVGYLTTRSVPEDILLDLQWQDPSKTLQSYNLVTPPSPLGISNYAALDEEDLIGELEHYESNDEKSNEIYSDFNILDPVERDPNIVAEEDQLHAVFARAPLEMAQPRKRRAGELEVADELLGKIGQPPSPSGL